MQIPVRGTLLGDPHLPVPEHRVSERLRALVQHSERVDLFPALTVTVLPDEVTLTVLAIPADTSTELALASAATIIPADLTPTFSRLATSGCALRSLVVNRLMASVLALIVGAIGVTPFVGTAVLVAVVAVLGVARRSRQKGR